MLLAIVAGLWGPIATHEGGHAVAGTLIGMRVAGVEIGNGRRMFNIGAVSVHAVPLKGRTLFRESNDTTSRLRQALMLVAGPACELFAAGLMFLVATRISSSLLVVLAFAHGGNALANLLPRTTHSTGTPADGVRLHALLYGEGAPGALERPGENAGISYDSDLAALAFRASMRDADRSSGASEAHGHDDQAGE